jgi:hypothetical protein
MEMLVAALIGQTPRDPAKARSVFEYLTTRLGTASSAVLSRLENVAFIPVQTEKEVKMYRPAEVYFAARDGQEMYRSAFTFVDFGEKANQFLRQCGVKAEPSVKGMTDNQVSFRSNRRADNVDIARLIMREPESMLDKAGSAERYLEQLRLLAANWTYFDATIRSAMKASRFLLASQNVPVRKDKKTLGGTTSVAADGEHVREWVLAKPNEVSPDNRPTWQCSMLNQADFSGGQRPDVAILWALHPGRTRGANAGNILRASRCTQAVFADQT